MLALLTGVPLYINYTGTGLADYKGSFASYLVSTTIGNYSCSILTTSDEYIMTIVPCAIYLIMFIFYNWWKCHYAYAIKEEDESKEFIKPEKFCVEV